MSNPMFIDVCKRREIPKIQSVLQARQAFQVDVFRTGTKYSLTSMQENNTSSTLGRMDWLGVSDAELITLVSQWRSQCLAICSITLIVWDIIITFDQEVEHIWKSRPRISLIKILFWMNRCYSLTKVNALDICVFPRVIQPFKCFVIFVYTQIAQVISVGIIQSALAIRVWALYEQNRGVLVFFIFLVGGSTIHATVVNCLSLELVFFLMTIIQVIRHNRSVSSTPLVSHIARTGSVFFFLIGTWFPATYVPARQSKLILGIRNAFPVPSFSMPEHSARRQLEQTQPSALGAITDIDMNDLEGLMCMPMDHPAWSSMGEQRELEPVAEEDEEENNSRTEDEG
ncbi:hypothetical protein K439DRAFT_1546204 [Ramaria rubella]|nr:hypothetical protein K439DRAFT_1546204 [Ramaria rubella]